MPLLCWCFYLLGGGCLGHILRDARPALGVGQLFSEIWVSWQRGRRVEHRRHPCVPGRLRTLLTVRERKHKPIFIPVTPVAPLLGLGKRIPRVALSQKISNDQ